MIKLIEKAKLSVRGGQKATGLINELETAGLPKEYFSQI
jgi:hypothetical protein